MNTGIVKFYIPPKGYGFIIDDETGREYFFHANDVVGEKPNRDLKVEFELKEGKKGLQATNVKLIN